MRVKTTPWLIGVDEAGRGPWAGPVSVAAVVLDPKRPIAGLGDSKVLSEKRREALFPLVMDRSLAHAIVFIEAVDIDKSDILRATFEGMRQAVALVAAHLGVPVHALIDGNLVPPGLVCPAAALVKGDSKEPAISAASILAKVARDRRLLEIDIQYPGYGFARHKGYGTQQHQDALASLGPCPEHRRSFKPVARWVTV